MLRARLQAVTAQRAVPLSPCHRPLFLSPLLRAIPTPPSVAPGPDANLEVVAALPADRILLETDAPWCEIRPSHASARHAGDRPAARDKKRWSPDAWVKSRNEPAGMVQVLAAVAGTRGTDPGELACQAYANTMRLFFPGEESTEEGDGPSPAGTT